MALAADLARRSLTRHPARTLFSVLGIALGIATVVAIFTLDHNTLLGRARSADPDWQAEIEVSPSAAVERPRAELEELPGVARIVAAFQTEATLQAGEAQSGGPQERVVLIALEADEARALDAYHILEGRDLGSEGEGPLREVLLGETLARRLALEPGDSVVLGMPSSAPQRDCVEGEWRPVAGGVEQPVRSERFEVVGVLARERLGRRAGGELVAVPFQAGSALFEGAHVETRYWLGRDPKVNLERLQATLGRAWSYELDSSVIIGQAADERAFRNGARFAGVLALVLGLYVIFHTLSVSLVERAREVGVLHALGASRAQIGGLFLAEAACIAVLGGIAGIAGGLVLARFLLLRGISTVGKDHPIHVFDVPWSTVLPLAAAGIAIALLGSIYPLARARGSDAVAALRGEELARPRGASLGFRLLASVLLALALPALYFFAVPLLGEAQRELVGIALLGVGVVGAFVAVPLLAPAVVAWSCVAVARPFARWWPLAGRLATRAMARGPARVAGGAAGLALVTAGFVGLRGMTASLEAEIRAWGREAYFDKTYVRNVPRSELASLVLPVLSIPGVLGLEPDEARTYVPFLLVGLREDLLGGYGPIASEPTLAERLRAEPSVILSTRLANHRGDRVGDRVPVRTPRGQVVELPVLAISDAYGYFPRPDERLYAVMSERWMEELFCAPTKSVASFSVRLAPDADRGEVEAGLRALFPQASIQVEDGPWIFRWHTSDVRRDFVLFDVLIVLTAALAGLGILNGQLLSALQRTKELGILKALGASRRQIAGLVLLESGAVGALGGAVGALVGAALVPIAVTALRALSGLDLPIVGVGRWVAMGAAGALGLALVAGLYPIWRMQRAGVLEAVRMGGS
jgi:putative ABC transport system permease protein